ncbi:unnamed protein product [Heligmosomoides polygyrus]|uniref:Ovule protein n=1 Tax=Heligmosomoides polygyrus TaxID=6339 RepID=A0A183FZH1_HELPZ|nr:unnamed protein product [Heligmosomoides polygyrus]
MGLVKGGAHQNDVEGDQLMETSGEETSKDKESSREEIKLAERMASMKHVNLKLTKTNDWKWWKKRRKIGIRKMN